MSGAPGPEGKPADYVRVPISRWQGRSTTMTTGGIVASMRERGDFVREPLE